MVETVAVYWEKQIRIYGISRRNGLSLVQVSFPVDQLVRWGDQLAELEKAGGRFEMMMGQATVDNLFQLDLLTDGSHEGLIRSALQQLLSSSALSGMRIHSPVAAVYFHGPHFQDRYGIADTTARALEPLDVEVLVSGCSGTSVYLVVPEEAEKVVSLALTNTFLTPLSRD